MSGPKIGLPIGRPPIGERAMTGAERQRRCRERLRNGKPAKPVQFPNVLAAAKAWEQTKFEMADAIVTDLGKPPKSFAECQRRIVAFYPEGLFDNYGETKGAAMMWCVAAAFPAAMRRSYGVKLCFAAGDPATLKAAASYAKTERKRLDVKLIKLIKQAMLLQTDPATYWRKRKQRRGR